MSNGNGANEIKTYLPRVKPVKAVQWDGTNIKAVREVMGWEVHPQEYELNMYFLVDENVKGWPEGLIRVITAEQFEKDYVQVD